LKNTYELYNTVFAAQTILTPVGQNISTKNVRFKSENDPYIK